MPDIENVGRYIDVPKLILALLSFGLSYKKVSELVASNYQRVYALAQINELPTEEERDLTFEQAIELARMVREYEERKGK